ncbi:hypothetical protein COCC4DRAFT_56259 [Bipolaris maydis ATCC 48331]|uniref:Uncharacterized protein n=2 Tax=Cochliobolus heterostrophus TaxID=5016 RepID=M2UPA2_COCH5|nr:uncharacterized protein COCC4DRAFT_56259 [Bipolaris maydis ATCC 48331]EMD89768.1 hypothetical protein COCHEDRAFT_1156803 [Bipolaris maydis C5]ENI10020.1 hypothetical protein COCC4DRAFT_56259 [Bipolaris maydis ATCC 48331]KAJ6207608.1 hypothetical protein PSV09DRAFT_1156803 [Bipolaris maydis]
MSTQNAIVVPVADEDTRQPGQDANRDRFDNSKCFARECSSDATTAWTVEANHSTEPIESISGISYRISKPHAGQPLSIRSAPAKRKYKTFLESTLNATLQDIHDVVQYAAVQAQRSIFGQDLQKTYAVGGRGSNEKN